MANYASLKSDIQRDIKQNGENAITGNLLQSSLLAMINSLGVGFQYMGMATPGTNPGTPDQRVFYIATIAGTYINFGNIIINDGEVGILKYTSAWTKDTTNIASLFAIGKAGINLKSHIPGIIDFGNIGNYTISQSQFVLTPYNTSLATTQLIPIRKGGILKMIVPNGYDLFCYQYEDVAGTNVVYYTQNQLRNIPLIGNFAAFELRRIDGGEMIISEFNGIYGELIEPNVTHFYDSLSYNNFTNIDIYTNIVNASINNSTGDVFRNVNDAITPFIPIKPSSKFVFANNYSVGVHLFFYTLNDNGEYVFIRRVFSNPNTTIEGVTPGNANAIRLKFNVSGDLSLVNQTNFILSGFSCSSFKNYDFDSYVTIDNILGNFTNDDFCRNDDPEPTTFACTKLIKVTPGQRFNFIINVNLSFSAITILQYADIPQTFQRTSISMCNAYMDSAYIVPNGIKYIRVAITKTQGMTIDDAVNCELQIVNVVENSVFRTAQKIINYDYGNAQGLAYENNRIFQARDGGIISIYDANTKEHLQDLTLGVNEHCNNIVFGDKLYIADKYGLLWVDGDIIRGFRIVETDGIFSCELIYSVNPPTFDTTLYKGSTIDIDFANKRFVQRYYDIVDLLNQGNGARKTFGDITIKLYSFSGEFENANFTLIHSWKTSRMWAMQGGRLRDDKLYILSGTIDSNNSINVFDIFTRKLVNVIDLRKQRYNIQAEPEGLEINGLPIVSTTNGLFIIR